MYAHFQGKLLIYAYLSIYMHLYACGNYLLFFSLHFIIYLVLQLNHFLIFPGYTINIYVEMFHSEKQFDELEIFDGTCIC